MVNSWLLKGSAALTITFVCSAEEPDISLTSVPRNPAKPKLALRPQRNLQSLENQTLTRVLPPSQKKSKQLFDLSTSRELHWLWKCTWGSSPQRVCSFWPKFPYALCFHLVSRYSSAPCAHGLWVHTLSHRFKICTQKIIYYLLRLPYHSLALWWYLKFCNNPSNRSVGPVPCDWWCHPYDLLPCPTGFWMQNSPRT